jgi:hypothetical protein
MNSNLKFAPRTFPSRIADLGFTAQLPADWTTHELPPQDLEFNNPTFFLPLGIVAAPHAAIVFVFAARPAHDDGTLHDWAWYHLQHNYLKPRAVGASQVAGVAAVTGEAIQESELGPVVVRFAFFEDGGRLVNLSLAAPQLLADVVRDAWLEMLKSFQLETPRGSRFEIDPSTSEPTPNPSQEGNTVASAPSDAPLPGGAGGGSAPNDKAENIQKSPPSFATYALADTDASLNEEHPTNANLRDRGIGLVPNVIATDDMKKFAIVAAGAIIAQFRVPFGWHVIDDGKRTLVFEPTGKIQISLNLIPREGRDNDAILNDLEAQMRSDYPHPEFLRLNEGKIQALGARNIADGNQPLEQYHLLYPGRYEDHVLRARVTATPDRTTDACNLAELLLHSMDFECFPHREEPKSESPAADQPAWWHQAVALEFQNKLDAAEQVIKDGCPYIGFAASTAEMYRLRMLRLKQAGDQAGALAAFLKSSDFIWRYASMATSGGEGAALSYERDQFRAQLVAEYGSDPEASQ